MVNNCNTSTTKDTLLIFFIPHMLVKLLAIDCYKVFNIICLGNYEI